MGRTKTIGDREVLAAAHQLFREHGHSASTREIARAAGISQAALYQRFGSKEDLFFRSMALELPELDDLLGPFPPTDVLEDLVAIGERITAYLRGFLPSFIKVLSHPLADDVRLREWHGRLPFSPILTALAHRILQLQQAQLIAHVPAQAVAFTIVAAAHSVAMFETFAATHERHEGSPTVRAVIEVLMQGLRRG